MVQWLGIHLPMQETWVGSLVQENPTRHGVTKLTRHNYWARAPQLEEPRRREVCARYREQPQLATARESLLQTPAKCQKDESQTQSC